MADLEGGVQDGAFQVLLEKDSSELGLVKGEDWQQQAKKGQNHTHKDKGSTCNLEQQQQEQQQLSSPGVDLVFKDVCVELPSKPLLQNISGKACRGELLAIMGPSGGGKTTLLNTLAGRMAITKGVITLNGEVMNKSFKRKISYVLQEDIFFSNLTLRETLNFMAMVRLPEHMPTADKLARVEDVVDALGIRKCLNTIIGDAWCRGLSGGEKKRASIACELITDPKLIYMDEPTSGLDYSTALSLVSTLKKVAVQFNKTVVITIHQPSSRIFFLFDELLLLCDGQVAYYGRCQDVIGFFENLDLHMESFTNPADFIVDKLKEDPEVKKKVLKAAHSLRDITSLNFSHEDESLAVTDFNYEENNDPDVLVRQGTLRKLIGRFKSKKWQMSQAQQNTEKGEGNQNGIYVKESCVFSDESKWPTSFWTQYSQLTIRTFRQSKARILDKLKICENIAICILVSLIWFQLPRTEETLRDRMGAIFFICIHWGFSPLFDAVSSFPIERVVIHKERAAGWYRLSAYYLAKMTSELPLIVIQPLIFVSVTYWCIGLNGFVAYCVSVIVVMTNSVAGQSIGLFFGILSMDFRRAMTMATVIIMGMMLLGGFYTRHLPFWLSWIKYISFLHYSFHSLLLLEFTDADPVTCMEKWNISHFQGCTSPNITTIPGDKILDYFDVHWSLAEYFLPLLIFIFGLRVGGYLLLRFVHRPQSV